LRKLTNIELNRPNLKEFKSLKRVYNYSA